VPRGWHLARGGAAALTLVLIVVAALIVVPVARLVIVAASGGGEGIARALSSSGSGRAVVNTVLVALAATALALPLGGAMALLLERVAAPGGRVLRAALVVPLLVPRFVLGYSWLRAYDRSGLVQDAVGLRVPGLTGPAGIVVITAVTMAPIVMLVVGAALAARAEPDLERAARASGATGWTAMRTVTLPPLRPALVAAAALTFAASVESFAIPVVLGARSGFDVMTTRMYQELAFSADPRAFSAAVVLALLMAAIVIAVVAPVDRLERVGSFRRTASPAGRPVTPAGGARARIAGAAAWLYLTLVVAIPLLALVLSAVTRAVGLPPTPSNWSLENVRQAFSGPAGGAFARSAWLAAAAAAALVVLGAAVAGLDRARSSRRLGTLVTLTFALPGSALAIGLIASYGRWIGGTLTIIFLAYLGKLWALSHRAIAASLERLPTDLVRAARVSGARPLAAIRTVVVPPLLPALVAAGALVFLFAFHEVTMSALLYGPGSQTIGVVVLNLQELGDAGRTSALACVMVAVTSVAALGMLVAWRRAERRAGARA
jgi:iron(III) transport system permease protein